ncbi:MAG: DUF4013 domain-containing protein [Anaerolineales bacterium]|nr:MAG: DUF4013 domain-containing protein [Anaerolineales bacterium]
MDIGSSFTYMFQDEGWIKKIVIGGVVSLIPILNLAAIGYVIQVIRNVRDGQPLPLPEWDQFGQYFKDGLWIFLIFLVWAIPIILVACLQAVGTAALAENEDMASAIGIISACFSCVMALWGLVIGIVSPAIMIRYAEVGEFMAGFRFGEIFSFISANVGSYIVVALLIWVAGLIASLGVILCVVGIIFTQFWSYLVGGNLMGQLAAQHLHGEPAA